MHLNTHHFITLQAKLIQYIPHNKDYHMQGMQRVNDQFLIDRSKELGKGNYGTVFKGYHISQNRIIAIKFIERTMVDRIPEHEREINVMAELAKIHHPNIMGYYGYEKNQLGLFFFLEFCQGGALKQLILNKISQMKVISLFKQLLNAMSYMNKLNKIHRDLKPDNILLDENEELKIADFGLARDIHIQMTKGACTPLYAAPEVLKLEPYDQKCDVWSAGLILYEMLTGKELFADVKTKKELIKVIQVFKSQDKAVRYPKEFHPAWEKITLSMLTYDKNDRPSFEQLAADFEKLSRQIQMDLIKKYGEQPPEQDLGLNIMKTLSPYQSRPQKKEGKQDLSKKLKQQRSFNHINDLRKYLSFFRTKNDMRTKLIRQFNNNLYDTLRNVYKYLLMFLSTAAYFSNIKEVARQIKEKKVRTPDAEVSEKDIDPIHQKEFNSILSEYGDKLQKSIIKIKPVLYDQIIAKILGNYMTRGQQRKIILEFGNILKLIDDAKNDKFVGSEQYNILYIKLINKIEVYSKQGQLQKWNENDVKTYAQIRIIGYLDQVIVNTNYRNDDYLRMKRQDIENKSKSQLIDFIRPFNLR